MLSIDTYESGTPASRPAAVNDATTVKILTSQLSKDSWEH